jgi:hypothetical protein
MRTCTSNIKAWGMLSNVENWQFVQMNPFIVDRSYLPCAKVFEILWRALIARVRIVPIVIEHFTVQKLHSYNRVAIDDHPDDNTEAKHHWHALDNLVKDVVHGCEYIDAIEYDAKDLKTSHCLQKPEHFLELC